MNRLPATNELQLFTQKLFNEFFVNLQDHLQPDEITKIVYYVTAHKKLSLGWERSTKTIVDRFRSPCNISEIIVILCIVNILSLYASKTTPERIPIFKAFLSSKRT